MTKRTQNKRVSFADKRTRVGLWVRWQALRRNPQYGCAVQACLQELQISRAGWIDRQNALGPRPSPPDGFGWLEIDRTELADLLLYDSPWRDPQVKAMTPAERLEWGRKVYAYRADLRQWEKARDDICAHIDACDKVLHNTAYVSRVLHSSNLPMDFEAGIPDEIRPLYKDVYATVSSICNAEIRNRLPSLVSFEKAWQICVPLAPEIPSLPPDVAQLVFANHIDYAFSLSASSRPRELTVTVCIRSGATKEVLLAQFDALLKTYLPFTIDLQEKPKRQQTEFSYYELMFRVYDLRRAGESAPAIAHQLWPETFEDNPHPYSYPNQDHHYAVQRVNDLMEAAKKLINEMQPAEKK